MLQEAPSVVGVVRLLRSILLKAYFEHCIFNQSNEILHASCMEANIKEAEWSGISHRIRMASLPMLANRR